MQNQLMEVSHFLNIGSRLRDMEETEQMSGFISFVFHQDDLDSHVIEARVEPRTRKESVTITQVAHGIGPGHSGAVQLVRSGQNVVHLLRSWTQGEAK